MKKKYDVKLVIMQMTGEKFSKKYTGDLIFAGGKPTLVIEWLRGRGASPPLKTMALDPKLLQVCPLNLQADYVYQAPLNDTQKFCRI